MKHLITCGLSAVALSVLVGCGSTVRLDDPPPVETRTPTATEGSAGGAAAGGGQAGAAGAPQSQVATIDLGRTAGAAGADGGAAALAGSGRTVYFDFDSFVVKDEYRGLLENHARQLSATKARRLTIEGHTDERGGREYNLALGQKRAEAVAKSLVLLGAADGQVEAVSFGKERPADPGHDEAAWAKNRRAELKDR